ncbi:ABC transporter substrate-binding protein [Cellulomonas sp. URHE0023]|uniref:ABC transporter substrate-binding protein n=1 Tax=Cellulomonas sp. URHE0023 TaxID=1380354 RepID=UPI00048143D3|nr:extracellular solute-binding protein [Cellulomonas sp. URHE0023]
MKRSMATALGLAAAASLVLAGCGSSSGDGDDDATSPATAAATEAQDPVTLSLAGWSLATTPEFQELADAFHAENPNITVELKEYDAANYDTQMIADLAAGSAPDVYVLKNLKNFYTYQSGGQLVDVSDVSEGLGDEVSGLKAYEVDGATFGVPYRQDSWYLYYNKDLFDAAGVEYPDGSWTWDDYADAAEKLTPALAATGAKGTYQHSWQSTVQGFALAQTKGASLLEDDFGYLEPYYDRALKLQTDGAQESLGTVTTNKLTYQAQFGTQKAAMMPMGSWYVATLIAQQASGDAQKFAWGIAPAPQFDSSTTGTSKTPITFGDPTGLGINPAADDDTIAAAKKFLAFAASEDGAKGLAGIGITPAYVSDAVSEAYFGVAGVPTDDLSKFAFSTHDTKPENPVNKNTAAIQNILNETHTGILSGSTDVAGGISSAESRVKSEVAP